MKAYARGGDARDAVRVAAVKAVVGIAPAGGTLNAWGAMACVRSLLRSC